MKKTLKKALYVAFVLVMIAAILPVAMASDELYGGDLGENASWVIDSDYTLRISGTGDFAVGWFAAPWNDYCDIIKNVVIEEGITNLPGTAFSEMESADTLTIPSTVTEIEPYRNNIFKEIIVSENNTSYVSVDGVVFTSDKKTLVIYPVKNIARSYIVPEGTEVLGKFSFEAGRVLTEISLPDSLIKIETDCFAYTPLEVVNFGANLEIIEEYAFHSTLLRIVELPDKVSTLDCGTFKYCSILETLIFGTGITSIDYDAFGSNYELQNIHYKGTQQQWEDVSKPSYFEDYETHFNSLSDAQQIEADCENDGHTAGIFCSECDDFITGKVINALGHSYGEDYFCEKCGEFWYGIIQQPTSSKPTVKVSDSEAEYQWYGGEAVVTEITDENASPFHENYEDEKGWIGEYDDYFGCHFFFTVSLKAGEKVKVKIDGDVGEVGLYDLDEGSGVYEYTDTDGWYELTTEYDGEYSLYANDADSNVTARAYTYYYDLAIMEGQNSATVQNPEFGLYYACDITYSNGESEFAETFQYVYAIISQPTQDNFEVKLNYSTDAAYQWYTVEGGVTEFTDENAEAYSYDGETAVYDAENGWRGVTDKFDDCSSATLVLEKGEVVIVKVLGGEFYDLGMYDFETKRGAFADVEYGVFEYELKAPVAGNYTVYTDEDVPLRIYVNRTIYTPVEGATSAVFYPEKIGNYACEVTFRDGTSEMSEAAEFKGKKLELGTTAKITATQTTNSITFKWDAVEDATGYSVYVYNGGWKFLENTTKLTYTLKGLTPGSVCGFAVRAYGMDMGKVVKAAAYKHIITYTKTVPSAVMAAADGTKAVTLNWGKVKGATGYRVFIKTSAGWKALKTTYDLTYTATGLSKNTKYTFAVRPYTKTDDGHIWADTYTTAAATTAYLDTPTARTASTATGRATVAWYDIADETGYQVWYSEKATSGYTKIANYSADTIKMYKTGLESGKTYYFRVRAYTKVAGAYVYSNFSSVVSLEIK